MNYELLLESKFDILSFLIKEVSLKLEIARKEDLYLNSDDKSAILEDFKSSKKKYDDLYDEIESLKSKIPINTFQTISVQSYHKYN